MAFSREKRHHFYLTSSPLPPRILMLHLLCVLLFFIDTSSADSYDAGAVCYFPIEYQGSFLIQEQSQPNPEKGGITVSYSEITIEADSIPPWGRCYQRRGNIVILKDSTGPQDCMRCLHLTLKTPNVIQIHTEGLGKCYTNEAAARSKCPTDRDVREKSFKEIMLFRKHIPGGLQSVEHHFCPFNGRFRFNYFSNSNQQQCESALNELGNCPHGDALGVKFRGCTFPNMDLNFLCLGDWEHPSSPSERYVALMDLRESPESVPKYRCGIYREESSTGRIYVSLSSDSTCSLHLKSATSGYESFTLQPTLSSSPFPDIVERSKCRFPEWSQAKWESSKVDGNTFVFKDRQNNFQILTSKCIMRQTSTANERYVVFTRSQCGEESYRCLWFKKRSPNILEFQFGQESTAYYSDSLCDDKQFTTNNWITQGRKSIQSNTQCPIIGDYSGVIPGSNGLCAKVASDCNNPDIMFYTVTACENRSHVFEERSYRCLGNWEEDNILYAYTERMDMPGHQCFAGKIFRSGEEVFIKEAGESCIRGEDPQLFGMNITKEAPCPRLTPSYLPSSRRHPLVPPPPQPPKGITTATGGSDPSPLHPPPFKSSSLPPLPSMTSSSSSGSGSSRPSSSFSSSSVQAADDRLRGNNNNSPPPLLGGSLPSSSSLPVNSGSSSGVGIMGGTHHHHRNSNNLPTPGTSGGRELRHPSSIPSMPSSGSYPIGVNGGVGGGRDPFWYQAEQSPSGSVNSNRHNRVPSSTSHNHNHNNPGVMMRNAHPPPLFNPSSSSSFFTPPPPLHHPHPSVVHSFPPSSSSSSLSKSSSVCHHLIIFLLMTTVATVSISMRRL